MLAPVQLQLTAKDSAALGLGEQIALCFHWKERESGYDWMCAGKVNQLTTLPVDNTAERKQMDPSREDLIFADLQKVDNEWEGASA